MPQMAPTGPHGATNRALIDAIREWEENTKDFGAEREAIEAKMKEEIQGQEVQEEAESFQYNRHLLAGGIAGLIADATLQPFDFVRTRHQISKTANEGIIHSLRSTYRQYGLSYLYKGFGAVAVGSPISNSLYYAGYGLAAIMLSGLVMVPGDIVVQRAQATIDKDNGALRVFKSVLKEEGIRGFYKNYWVSIGVWGPYCSMYFAVYEYLKAKIGINAHEEQLGLKYFLCSATAGTVGATITNPLDVVRVRSMVVGEGGLDASRFRYAGIRSAFIDIIRNEGILALGKGLKARILWYVANDAIGMTMYEKLKHYLGAIQR
eukprot:jgi/Bigna1/78420/fgenesh1_pg.54_\